MIKSQLVSYPLDETKEQKALRIAKGLPQPMVEYTQEWDDEPEVVQKTGRKEFLRRLEK